MQRAHAQVLADIFGSGKWGKPSPGSRMHVHAMTRRMCSCERGRPEAAHGQVGQERFFTLSAFVYSSLSL